MAARGKKLIKIRRRAEFKHSRQRLKRDDQVQVIAGDEAGKIGKILRVLPARQRVVVEGANMIFRHVKKSQQNPQGGRVEREGTLPISSVAPYCGKCARGTRIRYRSDQAGKVRVCARCGEALGG